VALRIAANTRWSRVNEKGNRKAETQMAAQEGMGRASCLVDPLRSLELDLACDQDWSTRFAADFIRGDSFFDRDCCVAGSLDWPHPIASATT
jgi:hypothetical protein